MIEGSCHPVPFTVSEMCEVSHNVNIYDDLHRALVTLYDADLAQFLEKEQLDVVHSPHFHLAVPASSVRELDIVREELKRRRTDDLLRVAVAAVFCVYVHTLFRDGIMRVPLSVLLWKLSGQLSSNFKMVDTHISLTIQASSSSCDTQRGSQITSLDTLDWTKKINLSSPDAEYQLTSYLS